MATQKKNKRSVTLAHLPTDPKAAYTIGHSDGVHDSLKMLLTTVVFCLMDTELIKLDELEGFYIKFYRTIEMIEDGQLTLQEITQILKRDYGCKVKVR